MDTVTGVSSSGITVRELREALTKVADNYKVYVDTGQGQPPIPLRIRDIETLSILHDGKLERGVFFLCTGENDDGN